MDVSDIPEIGYLHIRCAGDASVKGAAASTQATESLPKWTAYGRCPKNRDGYTRLAFEYDDTKQQWASVNDKWEGTKIAGHPVLLTLAIDENSRVVALNAKTNPEARAYMRKKAYLLSIRVKARYGRDGWSCTTHKPSESETPVGGVYINEHCEKSLPNRRIKLQTKLFRSKDQSLEEFTNSTEFLITPEPS